MPGKVLKDNQFWLQAMGDHAIIVFENLAPVEAEEISKACLRSHSAKKNACDMTRSILLGIRGS